MSASASSVRSLTAATSRWSLAPTWRSSILFVQTSPCPPSASSTSTAKLKSDGMTREQLLEQIQLDKMKAEERIARLKAEAENPQSSAAAGDSSSEEDDDESAAAADRGDEKHDAPVKPPGVESEEEDDEEDADEEEEGDYDNELEYYVYEILCLDAINHDPPSGKEVACAYCKDGKKFESEFSCAGCAYVRVSARNPGDAKAILKQTLEARLLILMVACFACAHSCRQGVCATCRKVVVLKSLEDPAKGAAICLALLTDESLLKKTLEIEEGAGGKGGTRGGERTDCVHAGCVLR